MQAETQYRHASALVDAARAAYYPTVSANVGDSRGRSVNSNLQKARDAAQLDNAKLDLQRDNTLIKVDATTQQALDTQRALVS